MTEYKVVAWNGEERMAKFVSMAIEDGWALHGGISITVDNRNNYHFAQALTRETPKEPLNYKN